MVSEADGDYIAREGDAAMTDNADQIAEWNGPMGDRWAQMQADLDALTRPFGNAALAAAKVVSGEAVIDVGCGCGDTTFEIARAVGANGSVLGVDVSRPMLVSAEARRQREGVANLKFVEADASAAPLPSNLDLLFSRFGVMFFEDPFPAFKHMSKSLKPGGRLAFVCWRAARENPWATVPIGAARAAMGVPAPQMDPYAPSPFAFADETRTRRILEEAGFTDVTFTPFDHTVRLGANAADGAEGSIRFGPAGRFIREMGEGAIVQVLPAMTEALKPFENADGCAPPGATWIVTAKAG